MGWMPPSFELWKRLGRAMRAKLHITSASAHGSKMLLWHCPACNTGHGVTVLRPANEEGPVWEWNGSITSPTITPSVRVSATRPLTEDEYQIVIKGGRVDTVDTICHFFIRAGKIEFCGDSTHELADKTIDMLEED